MGQVDDVHDAPDQRQAHGGEPVDEPYQHAVDDRSEDAEHAGYEGRDRRSAAGPGLISAWLRDRVDQIGGFAASGQTTWRPGLPFTVCHCASTI